MKFGMNKIVSVPAFILNKLLDTEGSGDISKMVNLTQLEIHD